MAEMTPEELATTVRNLVQRTNDEFMAMLGPKLMAASAIAPDARAILAFSIYTKALATIHAEMSIVTGIEMQPTPDQVVTASLVGAMYVNRDQTQPFKMVEAWQHAAALVEQVQKAMQPDENRTVN